MVLTDTEKENFLERIRALLEIDVIQRKERDEIYRICLVACGNEMARMRQEG